MVLVYVIMLTLLKARPLHVHYSKPMGHGYSWFDDRLIFVYLPSST